MLGKVRARAPSGSWTPNGSSSLKSVFGRRGGQAYSGILAPLVKAARRAAYASNGFRSEVDDPQAYIASEENASLLQSVGEIWNETVAKYDEAIVVLGADFSARFGQIHQGVGSGSGDRTELAALWLTALKSGYNDLVRIA